MKKSAYFIGLIIFVSILIGLGTPALAAEAALVDLLVDQTGVTTQQAEGGAGAVFNTAKENMGVEDFSKVTTAMPEVESLMAVAPEIKKDSGSFGGFSSMVSKNTGSAGKMADLYSSFSELGLNKETAAKFIPIILDFAKSESGKTVYNLLKSALS